MAKAIELNQWAKARKSRDPDYHIARQSAIYRACTEFN